MKKVNNVEKFDLLEKEKNEIKKGVVDTFLFRLRKIGIPDELIFNFKLKDNLIDYVLELSLKDTNVIIDSENDKIIVSENTLSIEDIKLLNDIISQLK